MNIIVHTTCDSGLFLGLIELRAFLILEDLCAVELGS
jgi:hypothetical protein